MAVSYVGAGSLVATGTSYFNVALPDGLADKDALLLFFYGRSSATVTGPRGWTGVVATNATSRRLYVYFRQYDAAEMAGRTYQVVNTVNVGLARILAFRTNTAGKIVYPGAVGNGYTATSVSDIGAISAPSSPPAIGAVVFFGARNDDWTSVATLSGDSLTWTELFDDASTIGNDCGMVADFAPWTSTPTLTSKTFIVTGGTAADAIGRSFLLTEAAEDTVLRRERVGAVVLPLSKKLSQPLTRRLIQAA